MVGILLMLSWNKVSICKLLWCLSQKKDKLWIKWVHLYYVTNRNCTSMSVPNQHLGWLRRLLVVVLLILVMKDIWLVALNSQSGRLTIWLGEIHLGKSFVIPLPLLNSFLLVGSLCWVYLLLNSDIITKFGILCYPCCICVRWRMKVGITCSLNVVLLLVFGNIFWLGLESTELVEIGLLTEIQIVSQFNGNSATHQVYRMCLLVTCTLFYLEGNEPKKISRYKTHYFEHY